MVKALANKPGIKLGISKSMFSKSSQVPKPNIIEAIAPVLVAFFQYNPAIIGINKDTRLNAEDSPTRR